MDTHLRALNRFGLGARIGETLPGGEAGPRDWLRGQLEPESALLSLEGVPGDDEIVAALTGVAEGQRSGDPEAVQTARRVITGLLHREATLVLDRRVATETPFMERLVAFWSNHLCVSVPARPALAALAGHYERTVVRPHVLGRFDEMLLASARHPAMLVYLDNVRSVGPRSTAGRMAAGRGRDLGLNENYARELLELHTLGVDGGYDQSDVEAAALVLTGWSAELGAERSQARPMAPAVVRPGGTAGRRRRPPGLPARPAGAPPAFVFRPELHEPGTKTVLGRRYGPGGLEEGEELVRDLARHPATAVHLATALVRHFVADEPPSRAVDRIADVWVRSDGDLHEVSLAVVDLDEAWDSTHRKLRTPQDWLVAALRAFRLERMPPALAPVLGALRHPMWAPPAPKGFDDLARVWADPDGLMNRAELARTLAARLAEGRLHPSRLLEVVAPDDDGVLAGMLSDDTVPRDERIALALGGPAFQWR